MMRLWSAAAVVFCAVPALADEKSPRDVMIAAFEASDCVLTLGEVNDAFSAAGIETGEVPATARQLAADGMVGMIDDKNAFLKSGAVCEGFVPPRAEIDPAVIADVIQVFEAHDCRIDFDDDPKDLFQVIKDSQAVEAAIAGLLNDGAATFEGAIAVLKVGDRCGE